MKTTRTSCLITVLALISVSLALGQSGRQYRRSAVMNGNQVRTVFGNWGVIGQPTDTRPRGSWKDDNNGYIGDVSPFVGAEVKWKDSTFRSVVTPPVSRPAAIQDVDPKTGEFWTMEPVDGYFAPEPNQSVAMSNNKSTWPPAWPDKVNDPGDPGWRGSWNGYFGKRISADLETYFVMDDSTDERFNFADNNPRKIAFLPDPSRPTRYGLGLMIRVRAMQWAQFLAQDNIFWLYEIVNTGATTYDRAVFGMLVGTYVGVTGSDGGPMEYDDDWSFYDVYQNITYTGDFDRNTQRNPRWNQNFPVGMVGYAFLESPGNPFDGIDNDGDSDSSAVGTTSPKFTSTSFDSVLITAGMRIVLIREDFSRVLFTVPNRDSVKIWTRGMKDSVWIRPGKTRVVEGNVIYDFSGNSAVNPNAYDGIDNNFNGLIDENKFLHFQQYKVNRNPPHQVLINVLRPVRYVDYMNGAVENPLSMIDERRDDRLDNNRNWDFQFDDVGRDGIGPTAVNYPGPDIGEGDGKPTSGYDDFGNDTGLPGEPHIDKTDVNESDQIGLSSFYYFTPAGQVRLGDDEALWKNLAPGFFDVPTSIENNRPTRGEDGDFIYGSGYFPLLAGATERFSLALVYGGGKGGTVEDDINDLLKNKKTVQKIYDANYQFPTPPEKPTLKVVSGDHQVTLYWDRVAEESIDPVLRVKDFEGYKVYKSTDPNFSDVFTITDATGTARGYKPLVQFDIKDDIKGFFRAPLDLYNAAQGFSFYLGEDGGLQHSYVDKEVDNGRRYFYAVVAYDRGDEVAGIFPGENTKQISILSTGEVVTDINTAVVIPNAPKSGYTAPADSLQLTHETGPAGGTVFFNIVDPTALNGHQYRVEFYDTQSDSLDNNKNGLIDAADSTEWTRLTSMYSVLDLHTQTEKFVSVDTATVTLLRKNLVDSTVVVTNDAGAIVAPAQYVLSSSRGTIRGSSPGSLPSGKTYTISYRYYPVLKSPNIQGTPFKTENAESDIFDGLSLKFNNYWYIKDTLTEWTGSYVNSPPLIAEISSTLPLELSDPTFGYSYQGYTRPADYALVFSNSIVDTSLAGPPSTSFEPRTPVNFRIYNRTEKTYTKFWMAKSYSTSPNSITAFDELVFLEMNPRGQYSPTWDILFVNKQGVKADTVFTFTTGDSLLFQSTKPYRKGDLFTFATQLPTVSTEKATEALKKIRVVPNPYVTAAEFEQPLPPGITSGRGERRIDFIHVPAQATIRIFTSRGDWVQTLAQTGNMEDGSVPWNLKTHENLDIAFGIYFYVVESPAGNTTGKIAIIK